MSNKTSNTNKFVEKVKKIHKNKYDYSKTIYIKSRTKIIIICHNHGEYKQTASSHIQGHGCPVCKSSKGEKLITKILDDMKVDYVPQKKFKKCKYKQPLSFDFYLLNQIACIEYDGIQHYKPIEFFGGKTVFKLTQIRDKIKNEYCKKYEIPLLRIKYDTTNDKIKSLVEEFIYQNTLYLDILFEEL